MIPHKLTLTNFIGIKRGLNRDVLVLDLDKLTGSAALIAVTGPNGRGKTTIIDNCQPYRLMPSHCNQDTGYSPKKFSYYSQCFGVKASKELEWSHEGTHYRTSLIFKLGKRPKTEAYLHEQAGSEWIPVATSTGVVSDGKSTTYDACVEDVLGSPDMFFTSLFSAQGSRDLNDYAPGEIKTLLSDMLGLSDIRKKGALAKTVHTILTDRYESMAEDIRRIDDAVAEKAEKADWLKRSKTALSSHEKVMIDAKSAQKIALKALADAEAGNHTQIENRIKRTGLERQKDAAKSAHNKSVAQTELDIKNAQNNAKSRAEKSITDIRRLDSAITQQNTIIQRHESTLSDEEVIKTAVNGIDAERKKVADLTKAKDHRSLLLSEINTQKSDLTGLGTEGKYLSDKASDLKRRSKLVDSVPCTGMDMQNTCPLMTDAVQARNGQATTEIELEKKRQAYAEVRTTLEAKEEKFKNAPDPTRDLVDAQEHLRKTEALAGRLGELDAARKSLADAHVALAQMKTEKKAHESEIQKERDALADHLIQLRYRLSDHQKHLNNQLTKLDGELDKIPPDEPNKVLEQANAAHEKAEQDLATAERNIRTTHADIANHSALIKAAETTIDAGEAAKKLSARLEIEIPVWDTMKKTLGNDGIIALSIDDAGPSLASLTNDLLTTTFGPRFTVRIDTQRETKSNGNMRETFDIIIFDAEHEGEASISDMSGGQKIWINAALTLAIAIYLSGLSGKAPECLFSDEADGALDAERKAQFLRMKRRALELCGAQKEFFISHTPELWEMADAIINVEDLAA